jgi:2-methylcitrate dehydratase PrpD
MNKPTLDFPVSGAPGLTMSLARDIVSSYAFTDLPRDVVFLAKQCFLDWLGVTIAGADEPLTHILLDEMREQGGEPQATIIGHDIRLPTLSAVLVNGSSSHALDYDDVHMKVLGHPSVPVFPAILALAEHRDVSGADFLAAFVAGLETECRIGQAVAPSHYAKGWHATGTVGTFGAAAACAHLLGLDEEQTAHALGIAATQAAGLKSQFGTMCKPLHAGKAAYNGLLAASLARRGFTSRTDALECEQGFADTQSTTFTPESAARQPGEFDIRETLFKYHAACYLTHSAIEAARKAREQAHLEPDRIAAVTVRVPSASLRVCNIQSPETGLETKFSLRHTVAYALTGADTAAMETYSDANARDAALVCLRERVRIEPDDSVRSTAAVVEVALDNGESKTERADVGIPMQNYELQWDRLEQKFLSLVEPVLGDAKATEIVKAIAGLHHMSVRDMMRTLAR